MAEFSINKNSHALSNLYQEVLRHASKDTSLKDISRESFESSINKVVEDKLKVSDAAVKNIEQLQFKSDTVVPFDFYMGIGIINSKMRSALSTTFLEKLAEDGHIQKD